VNKPPREVLIVLAISVCAQRLLIDELKAARRPVAIYDTTTSIGWPAWGPGHITSDVRHYEVSEYVLRGRTPGAAYLSGFGHGP
jgi:hypothetical protein